MRSESIVSSCLQLKWNPSHDSRSWKWERGSAVLEGVRWGDLSPYVMYSFSREQIRVAGKLTSAAFDGPILPLWKLVYFFGPVIQTINHRFGPIRDSM